VSKLLTAKRRAKRGLDTGRASATLLLSGECQLGSGLHAHTKSLTDLVRLGGLLLDGLRRRDLLNRGCKGHVAAKFMAQFRSVVGENLRVMRAPRDDAGVPGDGCVEMGARREQVAGLSRAGAGSEFHHGLYVQRNRAGGSGPHSVYGRRQEDQPDGLAGGTCVCAFADSGLGGVCVFSLHAGLLLHSGVDYVPEQGFCEGLRAIWV